MSSRGGSPAFSDNVPAAAARPLALPNEFSVAADGWVQLSPYGDFPHARGLQRVTRADADAMVAQFNSFLGRAGRLFGGAPFYVGHPDLPGASELADRKAYGWVSELEARAEGLFGRVNWSDEGLALLRQGYYRFLSPLWEAREIARENGRPIYQPIALLSVGLTNQPNLPVKPIANEEHRPARDPLPLANTASHLGQLGARRSELLAPNRPARIRERVLAKVRLGLSYDDAWTAVKRDHADWFNSAD